MAGGGSGMRRCGLPGAAPTLLHPARTMCRLIAPAREVEDRHVCSIALVVVPKWERPKGAGYGRKTGALGPAREDRAEQGQGEREGGRQREVGEGRTEALGRRWVRGGKARQGGWRGGGGGGP